MRKAVLVAVGAVAAAALWWRRNPSACPYSQRFWVEGPHPLVTRSRLREALAPQPGERLLEVGPGTGYYALPVAEWLGPDGTLEVFDLQQEMLDHTLRRAGEAGLTTLVPTQGDARSLPYPDDAAPRAVARPTGLAPEPASADWIRSRGTHACTTAEMAKPSTSAHQTSHAIWKAIHRPSRIQPSTATARP